MKQKLNVLFLCSWYPSRVTPKNGDFIQRHAEAVAKQHNVSVIHVITDANATQNIEINIREINNIKTIIGYIKSSKNPLLKWVRYFNAYRLLIKKVIPFNIIHVNKFYPGGIIAYWLKKTKKIPYIITEHHTQYHKPYSNNIGKLEKFISKFIVKNASFVCPVSDNLGDAMKTFGLNGNYQKVPNVVDVKKFSVVKKNKTNAFTLLHVSSMAEVKNVEGILNVVKKLETKLETFQFFFIGGNATNYIKLAKEKNLNMANLKFIDFIPHEQMIKHYQNADVFVLFSDVENLPCVILESFSCGTPVISTNVGGISEYFPDDFGMLISPRKEEELVEAILKFKNDFNVATPKNMHNYVVSNFSEEQICEDYSKIYFKVLT